MSTRPGVVTSRAYARWSATVLALASTALVACDQPTEVRQDLDQLTGASAAVSPVSCAGTVIGANNGKPLTINVLLSNNTPGVGVTVTLVNQVAGPVCEAQADASGTATFNFIKQNAQFIVVLLDEVNASASQVPIIPVDPNTFTVGQVADAPTVPGIHQRPTLLKGAACTTQDKFTWNTFTAALGTPCSMPAGNGYTVNVTLQETSGTQGKLVGVGDLSTVILAAISPWGDELSQAAACSKLPWIASNPARYAECSDPNKTNGPAGLQAMGAPVDAAGNFTLGSVDGPVVIEAVLSDSGFTLFGTAVKGVDDLFRLYLVPGMCRVQYTPDSDLGTVVLDEKEPSGFSALDLLYTFSTIGLTTATVDNAMVLQPVPSTIVVGAAIKFNAASTGKVVFSFKTTAGASRSITASFTIDGENCTWGPATGNGIALLGSHVTTCIKKTTDVFGTRPETEVFVLALVLTGVSDLVVDRSSATYEWTAGRDKLDAARFSYLRGALPLAGQSDTSCPVPTNNDGRWDEAL